MRKLLFLAPLLALAFPLTLPAQVPDDVPLSPIPYTSSGTARFFPVARDLLVPPGGRVVQILNVFGMDRVSVQAVGHSTPGDSALRLRIGFGPPHVFDPAARLDLVFPEGDTALVSGTAAVRGPRMTVVLDNERAVPVMVSVGVYASN